MDAPKGAVKQDLVFLPEITVEHEPSSEVAFVFVNNSLYGSSTRRRGKQGGSYAVRSHVSRRSKREKREQEGLEENSNQKVIPASLAPRASPSNEKTSIASRASHHVGDLSVPEKQAKRLEEGAHGHHTLYPSPEQQLGGIASLESTKRTNTTAYNLSGLPPNGSVIRCSASVELLEGGRLDHFSAFPVSNASIYMHELVDHCAFISSSVYGVTDRICSDI